MKFTILASFVLLQALSTSAQGLGGGAQGVNLGTTTTKPVEPTTVYVTSTLPNGSPTVVASIYTQQFPTMYDSIYVPSGGSIGLGTETGKVGAVKETHATGGGARVGGRQGIWCEGDAWLLGLGVGIAGVLGGGMLVL